jgi:hypothetical protein
MDSNSDSDVVRSDSEDRDESIQIQTRNLNFMDLPKDIHMKLISMLSTNLWNKNIFLYTNLWSVIGALRLVNKSFNRVIHQYITLSTISDGEIMQNISDMTSYEEYVIRQTNSVDEKIDELDRIPTQNLKMYQSYYIGFIIVTILCLISAVLLSTLLFKIQTHQLGCKSWQRTMGSTWNCQKIDTTTAMFCSLSTDNCICNNSETIVCQSGIPIIGFVYTTLSVDILMLVGYIVMYGLCCKCRAPGSVSSRKCIKRCGEFTWTYCLTGFFVGSGCFLYAVIAYTTSV